MTIEPALKKRKLDEPTVETVSTDETRNLEDGSTIENKGADGKQKESKRSKKGQNKVKSISKFDIHSNPLYL